jgi:hypothetical protein
MKKTCGLVFAVLLAAVSPSGAVSILFPCEQDHTGPVALTTPLPDKLGEIAGYQVMGLFLEQGGFGCPRNVVDGILAMNTQYFDNEYLPRYREALAIYNWLDSGHLISEEGQPPVDCPVCGFPHNAVGFKDLELEKVQRLNELSLEIDTIWVNLADQAWWMIPQDSRDDYLEWVQAHNH